MSRRTLEIPTPGEIPEGFSPQFADDQPSPKAPTSPVKTPVAVAAPRSEVQISNAPPVLSGGHRVQIAAKTKNGKVKWSSTLWVFALSINKDAVMLMLPAEYPTLECEAGTSLVLSCPGHPPLEVVWLNTVGVFTTLSPQMQVLCLARVDG